MIITKTPLRISFCGGGTDLPAFYEKAGYGAVLSTSIDKYVYLAVHRYFENQFLLKYSASELAASVDEIKHPLIRECIRWTRLEDFVEITSFADIPSSGSGLGSSSAFSVGLIHALMAFQQRLPSKETCANGACEVEIGKLLEPIGKQDQYAAAYGGLNYIRFNADGSVWVEPVIMPTTARNTLQGRLCLFYTGVTRKASSILSEQRANTTSDEKKFSALVQMRDQAATLRTELAAGNLDALGHLLNEGWQLKRELASGITSPHFDEIYQTAQAASALGGKILGAGGGGFSSSIVMKRNNPLCELLCRGMRVLPFAFENHGTRIIFVED